jgi:hypothetical protein
MCIITKLLTRKTKLNELERKFAIPSVRKPPRADEARQAIIDEVEKDVNHRNGPIYIKSRLKDKGIMIPRYVSTCQPARPSRLSSEWPLIIDILNVASILGTPSAR